MDKNTLTPTPRTLLIFIDETGHEALQDPKNPTFGRGACAVLGRDYHALIKKPWRKLKRERLGGAKKPFHATEFEHNRPTQSQISGINRFLRRPFYRFAAMIDHRTTLPEGVDPHSAISILMTSFIRQLVATSHEVASVALVVEASNRGDNLVERDFDLSRINLVNARGRVTSVDGCFMDKRCLEPGLEVADLIAHTAGRQSRSFLTGKEELLKDFEHTYWHSTNPPTFLSIDAINLMK